MMTQQELEKYLWGAATALRGTIDAGDYKQYIFPLMFFKRISDVYDEEFNNALAESDGDLEYAAFAENHHFQVPDGAHWKDVRETTTNIGLALQNAMRAIEKANPDTLEGIFGDASWTNKDRLSDAMLTNLIEHYSQHTLDLKNVPDDKLGNAYEYLIKKFADDSGHTAAEFYTNRTVVKLMTMIMDPQPGESVYDPTCGSGGLLLNCALHLKDEGKEYRTLKLYGQEINLLTSAIARMNMFMHGIEEFDIVRGDTLTSPALLENDELKKFNVILANPPYSISQWDNKSFENDPFGRNMWGKTPAGCADYAFQQHIHKSLNEENGRCAILWPHGILFREMEKKMREEMIKTDTIESVIALGPNLFYNSPMEASILICNNNKKEDHKGKILFIDALNEVQKEKTNSYLTESNIKRIFNTYSDFKEVAGFSKTVTLQDVLDKDSNLKVSKYIRSSKIPQKENSTFKELYENFIRSGEELSTSMEHLFKDLK
ncbi:MAG: class I SAM-dependent DNA methyltransferase [Aliiglaciecola sp.]|uniref:type I restriction-modification system subunit M n=1 Tax=Aliiglaciecola sp. TaxID=1872441 RepID=UPI0032970A19